MCDHTASDEAFDNHMHVETQQIGARGSKQRLKLWDLPSSCHCPVVGVCIPLAILRKLVNKVVHGETLADDYEIHVGAVSECTNRNRLSKAIQEELDRRYAQAIYQLRHATTSSEVYAYWRAAEKGGDIAGAFWTTLTHPYCDATTRGAICRAMHMIQHQAGARARIEQERVDTLLNEHRILTSELGKVQTRCTKLINLKTAEIKKLDDELQQARAFIIQKDTALASLTAELAELRTMAPDLPARIKLKDRITELINHLRHRNHEIVQAQRTIEALQQQKRADAVYVQERHHAVPINPPPATIQPPPTLDDKTVLCVGGRNNVISRYRNSVESLGGRFSHHDGGIEDNVGQLDATLAAADLVICQTGCISHNAYWRVKDHCKRTGKRCVFVDNPSHASFHRVLVQVTVPSELGSERNIEIEASNSN